MNYDIQLSEIADLIEELEGAFDEIQMARTPFQLEHFVIGYHVDDGQQYAQCVLEMSIKWQNLRRAKLHKRRLELEIERLIRHAEELEDGGDWDALNRAEQLRLKAAQKEIDKEDQDRAALGAVRELKSLYDIWKRKWPKKRYTREELNARQPEYWHKRALLQAQQDMQATGRIGVGNQDLLRELGMAPAVPELDHVRDVERRYLQVGDQKALIAVPTEEKATEGLACLEGLITPSGVQVKYFNVYGRPTADAYNEAVMECLRDRANFLLTVEDDTFPPPEAFVKLLRYFDSDGLKNLDEELQKRIQDSNWKLVVGAWYPKRNQVREGAPIVVLNGKRKPLAADGEVHEVYTIPQGCTLFPAEVFLQTDFPWFATTDHLTQDSFFSQKAREAGWTLLCDTSIRCKHVDRESEEVYE